MSAELLSPSPGEIKAHLWEHASGQGFRDVLRRLEVTIGDDAIEEPALFITAIVDADAESVDESRLVGLTRSLHDGARTLGLPTRWYVRVQGEDAMADDPTE